MTLTITYDGQTRQHEATLWDFNAMFPGRPEVPLMFTCEGTDLMIDYFGKRLTVSYEYQGQTVTKENTLCWFWSYETTSQGSGGPMATLSFGERGRIQ